MAAIRAAKPKQLFVIADGPRQEVPSDQEMCRSTRAVVEEVLDWPCDVQRLYADENIGMSVRMSTGFDWVFTHVERAILLEDDCLPEPTFFRFCDEMLERYQDDLRVRTVAGSNFLFGQSRNDWSYYFSRFHNLWGWATWRRSWEKVDMTMRQWPYIRDHGWMEDMLGDRKLAKFWGLRMNRTHLGYLDSYSYPYHFSCWLENGLSITPSRNMVSNTGFGDNATNTFKKMDYLDMKTESMDFPLKHPPFMVPDMASDKQMFKRRLLPERAPWLWRTMRYVYYRVRGKDHGYRFSMGRGSLENRENRCPTPEVS